MKSESDSRNEIVAIGRRMADTGFIVAIDGNISCRLKNGHILITPSGVSKGALSPSMLIVVDLDGKPVGRSANPSAEISMHLLIYKKRRDVMAVVHAHPPTAVALSLAGVSMAHCVIPEVVLTMGEIPTAPYATPTTHELADSIAPYLDESDVIILERHGSVTCGLSLQEAYNKLEKLEHAAHITMMATQLGGVKPLSRGEVAKLIEVRQKMGITTRAKICSHCSACENGSGVSKKPAIDKETLLRTITDEVLQVLKS